MDRCQGGVAAFVLVAVLTMATAAQAQGGITDMKKGEGGSAVQGSAGPSGSSDGASDLARCDKPLATMAVVEPQSHVLAGLSRHGLGSPTSLIRLMIQQSNCFIVVERGVGMQNMMQERALARGGELKQDSNVGGGQMASADYILTPAVIFSEDNAGGVGGGVGGIVGGLFGRGAGAVVGGIAGGLKFKEAQTSMLVADTRSGIQVAAAEGSARKSDFRLGGLLGGAGIGGGGAVAAGGYSNTNEGKIIAASLADNYNGVVRGVRGHPSLQRNVGSLATEAAARTRAGATYNEGDVLRPKIANVKLFSKPADDAASAVTLGKADELIFMGKEQDGFISVETSKGAGWVKKALITR